MVRRNLGRHFMPPVWACDIRSRPRHESYAYLLMSLHKTEVVLTFFSYFFSLLHRSGLATHTKEGKYHVEKDLFSKDVANKGRGSQERLQELTKLRNGATQKD